jgi:phosphoribosylformylglycinamidine synthase
MRFIGFCIPAHSLPINHILITIGDRSVGGLTARDQFDGPGGVPVADCAVTLMGYNADLGEAMAMGERIHCDY